MPWVIAGILSALWIGALLASFRVGGLIHLLPVIAVLVIVQRMFRAPQAVDGKRANGIQPAFKPAWKKR